MTLILITVSFYYFQTILNELTLEYNRFGEADSETLSPIDLDSYSNTTDASQERYGSNDNMCHLNFGYEIVESLGTFFTGQGSSVWYRQ